MEQRDGKAAGYDVIALGELLIDLTQNGRSGQGNPLFEANPGGAPCNVLAMLSRQGKRTAFIGKVGRDSFGRQLREALLEAGIDASYLLEEKDVPTTLAFVHRLPDGDRDFSFYRSPGADVMLRPEEIDGAAIRSARMFHYGSLSLTDEPVKSATKKAVSIAGEAGVLRSFDPNLRPPLWRSQEEAREQIAWGLAHCEILKISDNEIRWFTGKESYDEGMAALLREYPGIRLLCLSMGPDGSRAVLDGRTAEAPAFLVEDPADTTGAGDTFCGGVLTYVLQYGLEKLGGHLGEMLSFANAAASLVTMHKGALRVMPRPEEIRARMKSRPF